MYIGVFRKDQFWVQAVKKNIDEYTTLILR